MALVSFCFIVPLIITSAVELSVTISVDYCGCHISIRIVLSASSYLALYNNSLHSASAADNIMLLMIVDMAIISPFGWLILSVASPM